MQTDELGKFLREVMPRLNAEERFVALEIYKALAASGTISVAALSERTRLAPSRVEAIVSSQTGVFRDERGDVVGSGALQTHARRWCGLAVCGNRAKAAAYRGRMQLVRRTD